MKSSEGHRGKVVAREALGPLLADRRLWPAKPWGHYWQIGALVVAREALGPLLADRSTVCLYVFLTDHEGLKRQNFFQS